MKQAILLIYPDGEIERILIDTETSHSAYLKKHLKRSKRFYELCKNLNFDWGIHFHIDQLLLLNGIIVLYNYNVKDIVNDSSFIYNYPVLFDTHLSVPFLSEKQKEEFISIYKIYKDLLVIHVYDREQKQYLEESFKL